MKNLRKYNHFENWGKSIADEIANCLITTLSKKDKASLVVPGGTTPVQVFEALSNLDIDWSKITAIPSDERCVPEGSSRSNERMIKETLIQNKAKQIRFISLHECCEGNTKLNRTIKELLPISACLLGMGEDLHVASLFPDSPELPLAISHKAPETVFVSTPSQPEKRVSLSLGVLRSAENLHLLFKGASKFSILNEISHLHEDPIAPISFFTHKAMIHYVK